MTELKVYKFLSYLLILPNALLALITLFGIFAAILNPVMFFGMILFLGVVLYAISSIIFLQKMIINNKTCSLKFKRNLKTTSILALLFCIMCLMNCCTILFNSSIVETLVNNFFEQSQKSLPPMVTRQMITNYIIGCTYFLGIYTALLLLHILMTYKFTKLYADMFVNSNLQQNN